MSMTENEALKLGKSLYENITSNANNIILTNEYIEFVEMAIQALEEIRQYRAIGTVEDISDGIKQSEEEFNMLTEYLKIGTIEEFKALKEKSVAKKPLLRLCGDCQRGCVDCDRYEDRCPTCNGGLYVESGKPHEHCPHCGQKLDWS